MCLFQSGCAWMYIDYIGANDDYWINPITKKIASFELENRIWREAKINQGKANAEYLEGKDEEDAWEYFGKKLYDKGYRFRTKHWTYCYRNKKECAIYSKYKE